MKMTSNMCKIVAELEYLIGSECYNPNSYDGWNDIEGCAFRYPVQFPVGEGKFERVKSKITNHYFVLDDDITPAAVTYMKYKFGSNELFVGRGLISILEFLEERYGLDFNKLESLIGENNR